MHLSSFMHTNPTLFLLKVKQRGSETTLGTLRPLDRTPVRDSIGTTELHQGWEYVQWLIAKASECDELVNFKASAPTRSVRVNFANIGPIAISLEFFTFPDYMRIVPTTAGCIKNLADAIGTQIPIRIGGTTGDYGTYDPQLKEAIHYTLLPTDKGVPKTLTYGPEYLRLASTLSGPVTLGLNRKANNLSNSLLAAQEAVKQIKNIHALEPGNEPNCKTLSTMNQPSFSLTVHQLIPLTGIDWSKSAPVAEGKTWDFAAELASQLKWQKEIATAVGRDSIIQAGNYMGGFRIADLARAEGASAAYVKSFGIHSYPQFACGGKPDLRSLMSHASIVDYVNHFQPEIQAAIDLKKDVYFSETNSVACGGAGISPTFGAALWTLDYIIQSLLAGIQSLYFHHGTLGNSQYSFWGRYSIGAPYYGAYFAALALNGIDGISQLDDGKGPYGAYLLTRHSKPVRILLYNSRYRLEGSKPKVTMNVDLSGLKLSNQAFPVLRLQARSSESRSDQGDKTPNISGLQFSSKDCAKIPGPQTNETAIHKDGTLKIAVTDSEAVIVQLDHLQA
ncbi:family 79 glycoside hydrolase [Melampsora americana]|nr:family 79 glycoside hydrolase [Melampsora americana]